MLCTFLFSRHYKISRIRGFYMRKIKFTQQNYHDKLSQIISDFPRLEVIKIRFCGICSFTPRVHTTLKVLECHNLNFKIKIQGLGNPWKLRSVLEGPWVLVLTLSNQDSQVRGTQRQFSENICSENILRCRIFRTFVVKFLACLPLPGFSNI